MKRIAGVSERLLECARSEFLDKGFQAASIREIAKKAETSARAVYTRFPNKEGLFDAIVSPVSNGLIELYQNYADQFWSKDIGVNVAYAISFDDTAIYVDMIDYIYDHKDEFLLIQTSLEGKWLTALIEDLTDKNLSYISIWPEPAGGVGNEKELMTKVLHMLTNSFYASMFEPLRHDMNRREARFYIETLCDFFVAGIDHLLKK
ncbi:TetR/AcrR family transcriptional regulator [Streptococcus mutans]|uniref:TetR/AcrR family transcriptional regulator n=1 Tax=Streptococcus mutans TaxID=1309 RepID=UPI0002B5FC06|nr:TetR/AcrR family transcriptional regulator [Streptococcus mutans]EMB69141.1 transcriptional regulator, TetR family protein [Streptococcus mutans 11SSST2]EMC15402.1 transcriptional regulator, TetR family protein [Streptococcus mutans NV1996]EMC30382.1 transcriptional regulator, TetR family protein [Streptococcus mutans U2A]MCB5153236.1 TetR/AcrR family transcriptional regulator [Streptococcus mutans]MDP5865104.1 helix-turn-helix domain-containing protein [Streptococcus mutans]